MSGTEKNKNEEVDLGALFSFFASTINGVINVFRSLLQRLISILVSLLGAIKTHFLKICIVLIIGITSGYFKEKKKTKQFADYMIVQANYGSVHQLYKTIEYYQSLIAQNATDDLASVFNITVSQAQSIRAIKIVPEKNFATILSIYNSIRQSRDSLSVIGLDLDMFKAQLSHFDYKYHRIQIEAEDPTLFCKFSRPIIASVEQHGKFTELRELNKERIRDKKNRVTNSLEAIDQLREVYVEKLKSDRVLNEGTVINMTKSDDRVNEIQIFDIENRLISKIEEIQQEELNHSFEIIYVISDFQKMGKEISSLTTKAYVMHPIIGLILLVIGLTIKWLNDYLNQRYKATAP
jgi:uncharacterized membrane protein